MQEKISATLTGPHIEAPEREFYVRFFHKAYQPDCAGMTVRASVRLARVMARTQAGAVEIAKYHHPLHGHEFRIEEREVVSHTNHTVEFGPERFEQDVCYVFVQGNKPGTRIGIVKRGESGYYRTDLDLDFMSDEQAEDSVILLNHRLGVLPYVAECMLFGSICGWETPGANPEQRAAMLAKAAEKRKEAA